MNQNQCITAYLVLRLINHQHTVGSIFVEVQNNMTNVFLKVIVTISTALILLRSACVFDLCMWYSIEGRMPSVSVEWLNAFVLWRASRWLDLVERLKAFVKCFSMWSFFDVLVDYLSLDCLRTPFWFLISLIFLFHLDFSSLLDLDFCSPSNEELLYL